MTISDQALLNAALRNDFPAFLHRCFVTLNPGSNFRHNWHMDAIGHELDLVRCDQERRLIINLPPRSLKSITVSVAFVAFMLGHNPKLKIFAISYSTELASKHAADFRAVIESSWYRKAFPKVRISRIADSDVYTTERGFRKTTSVNATLTGLGGDIFIIDDPLKPADAQSDAMRSRVNDWVSSTLISRLDDKATGKIIVVMQRVHQEDLTGHLLENSKGWKHLSLAAIAPTEERVPIGNDKFYIRKAGEALHRERESLQILDNVKHEMGSDQFSAQYQQSPVPPGGAMIRRTWLCYYDTLPPRTYMTKIIMSWDTAAKDGAQNDWSVCTVWMVVNKQEYYLLDLVRGRYEYPRLREIALALAAKWKPDRILIEDASTGIALAQELKQHGTYAVKPVSVERDKVGRVYVQQHKFEAGLVRFPRGAKFLADLEAELLSFPQGKTDDIVDSISQALAHTLTGYDTSLSWV